MVVSREFVSLEKLNGRLVELKHDDFMQQVETLDVALTGENTIGQACDAGNLGVLAHEKGTERLFSIAHVLQLVFVGVSLADSLLLPALHLVLLVDRLQDRAQVQQFEFKPTAHVGERILHLIG